MNKLILSAFLLVTLPLLSFGQSSSIEELGQTLAKALISNDSTMFDSLIFSKEEFLQFMRENVPEGVTEEMVESAIKDMEENYETQILSAYFVRFQLAQYKVTTFTVDLSDLKFEVVAPEAEDPFMWIHAALNHPNLKHLYFPAIEYKEHFYLGAPFIHIVEEPMEF